MPLARPAGGDLLGLRRGRRAGAGSPGLARPLCAARRPPSRGVVHDRPGRSLTIPSVRVRPLARERQPAVRAVAMSAGLPSCTKSDAVAYHDRFLPRSPEGLDAFGGGVRSADSPLVGTSAMVSPSRAFLWSGQHLQSKLHRHRCTLNTAEPPNRTRAHGGSRLRHMLPHARRCHLE